MAMLAEVFIPKLRAKFPDRGLIVGTKPCARFPATHADFGDILIHDDGEELTLEAGRFTHGHFSNWDASLPLEQRAESIVNAVIDFLELAFADGYVFWGSHDKSGGWHLRDAEPSARFIGPAFVWSGPIA